MILMNLGKKTEPEEDNIFKPALLPHFQTAADKLADFKEAFERYLSAGDNQDVTT